jgi:hypothetical protein
VGIRLAGMELVPSIRFRRRIVSDGHRQQKSVQNIWYVVILILYV